MSNRYYYIETWGCQMNEHDSEAIAGILEEAGYSSAENVTKADLIILNTCSVREKADSKVMGRIGRLKKLKMDNPNLIIGICGCMMQQEGMKERILKTVPFVDLIFGTHNIHRLPELLNKLSHTKRVAEVWPEAEEIVEDLPFKYSSEVQAYVNITFGCDNFCSYCIVPYTRGRERSRKPENVLNEIQKLAQKGIKEVMLLGQNVNSYGKGLSPHIDFADLMRRVDKIEGIERIRFMTSHPKDFSDKIIQTVVNSKHICPHFHLPLQAGSNKILKAMHRGYTKEGYLELVQKIRHSIPDAAITTDIIVGFPGETNEDFQETLEVVKEAKFDAAFTFIYSPRPGTSAFKMNDPIPLEEKKANFEKLLALQNQISFASNQKLMGKNVKVLVEGKSKTNPKMLSGHTNTNKTVIFEGDIDLTGKIIDVKITSAHTWYLEGEIVKE